MLSPSFFTAVYEVCRQIRLNEQTREIPIIFLTAKTDTASIVKGFELGAVDYVTKPFNAYEVLVRVETHLKLHCRKLEIEEKNTRLLQEIEERKQAEAALGKSNRELKSLAHVKNRMEIALAQEQLQSELNVARKIRLGILPKNFPGFSDHMNFDLYATLEPTKEVGGDLYDFFFIDDHHLCFIIGDVSGKGIPAALLP